MYQFKSCPCLSILTLYRFKWCVFIIILLIISKIEFNLESKFAVVPDKMSDDLFFHNNLIRRIKSIKEEVYEEHNLYDILETRCKDSLSAADPMMSKVERRGNYRIYVGDVIEFMVTLFDGYRNIKMEGNDHLRTRLYNDNLKAYVNGDVIDHKNGSYTVTHNALWVGLAQVEIELLYPKEVIAAMIRIRQHWNFGDIYAVYKSATTSELTRCHQDKLKFKSYGSDVCNLSYWNSTLPWYCVKPENKNLNCKDLKGYMRDWEGYVASLNECELHLAKRSHYRIGNVINVTVQPLQENDTRVEKELPQCRSYNRRKSWFLKQPKGFFYKGKWTLGHCKGIVGNIGECLQNTIVYLWGDSTTLQWLKYLVTSKLYPDCTFKRKYREKWHVRQDVYCKRYNLWLIYIAHNIPGTAGSKSDIISYFSKPLSEQIQDFKNTSKRIVILHIYAHLQLESIQFFIANILVVRHVMENLDRMDETKIFIKLPHTHRQTFIEEWSIRQPDYIGLLYESIVRKAFIGLYESVIALNSNDMTIATKNIYLHPGDMVISAMVEQLLMYVCDI